MPPYVQWSPLNPLTSLMVGDVGYSFGAPGAAVIATNANGGLTRVVVNGAIQVKLTTTVAHKFQPGFLLTILGSLSVGGTNFDGNYVIYSTPSTTTAYLVPLDAAQAHLPLDTGGGGKATSIQGEQPSVGLLGVVPIPGAAFAVKSLSTQGVAAPFSADGMFDAAPGVFEVDVQTADVDENAAYVTVSNGNITTVNAGNSFHFDAQASGAKFARLNLQALANSVNFIGIIKR